MQNIEIQALPGGQSNLERIDDAGESLPNQMVDSELFIRKAFEEDPRLGCELLYRRYYGALCSHAVRYLSSKAIAEDLVAEMFCELYAADIFGTITTSYRAYLYKTVRHRSFNYLRQALCRDSGLEEVEYYTAADVQQPDAIANYEELRRDVEQAILTLPIHRRRIYLMHRFEGKKYAEIADELSLSVRTVEVQIRQASHHLRNLLKNKWLAVTL
jgi:RNA polymerase sigma-70 factor (family 1)